MRLAPLFLTLAACGAATPVPDAPAPARRDDGGVDVILTTVDGVKLTATHWTGPASPERCVVLVHELGADREEWAPLVPKLRGRYDVLAIDVRGHGGSTRGPHGELGFRRFGTAEWTAAVHDVEAAAAWYAERGIADSDCVYMGASIGASLVARFAGDHPDTAGLVLLSPGMNERGVAIGEAIARYPNPVLLVGSGEDGMADTLAELDALIGARAETLVLEGNAHGIATIADDRAALARVLAFVDQVTASGSSP